MNVLAGPGAFGALGSAALQQPPSYRLEFYESADGSMPVRDWIRNDLTPGQRRQLGVAMRSVLQRLGIGVCGTGFGKALSGGLFEFRLRLSLPDTALLRVFCHAHGDRLILLLGGYDKARDPNARRQQREIAVARHRLADYHARQRSAS
jgi:hypothetical protein